MINTLHIFLNPYQTKGFILAGCRDFLKFCSHQQQQKYFGGLAVLVSTEVHPSSCTCPIGQQSRSTWLVGWIVLLMKQKSRQKNYWSVKAESCGCTVSVVIWFFLTVRGHSFPPEWLLFHPKLRRHLTKHFSNSQSAHLSVPVSSTVFLPPIFFFLIFFWLSLNLKSKIRLNWLQRALGGFVSTVMRVLIGPEAQAANRPLLVSRGPLLAR